MSENASELLNSLKHYSRVFLNDNFDVSAYQAALIIAIGRHEQSKEMFTAVAKQLLSETIE